MFDVIIHVLACIGAFNICNYLADKFMKWLDNVPHECPGCHCIGMCSCEYDNISS